MADTILDSVDKMVAKTNDDPAFKNSIIIREKWYSSNIDPNNPYRLWQFLWVLYYSEWFLLSCGMSESLPEDKWLSRDLKNGQSYLGKEKEAEISR